MIKNKLKPMLKGTINPKTDKPYSNCTVWRHNNSEAAERSRLFSRSPEQLLKSSIRTIKNRKKINARKRIYYKNNKERIAYLHKIKYDKQKLKSNYQADYYTELKPQCEICGSTEKLERHHWRYDKPLLVNTLCRQCHRIQHMKNFIRWQMCKMEANKQMEAII